MNESLLRWQGRIGSLKGFAFIVLIFVVIFLFPVIDNFNIAIRNASGSQAVTISQLVSGTAAAKQYVSVSGLASYDLAYTETEDGVTKAIIYPLIDQDAGTVIFVRTTQTNLATASDAIVTVAGLTTKAPSDLKRAIEKDIADINAAGFQTNTVLYIEEGKKPGQTIVFLMQLAGMGLVGMLCIVTFFFPTIVFRVFPPQQVAPGETVNNTVKATGTFVQVKEMEPLEFGKPKRKFTNSNANVLILDDKSLGVYIHFIYTTRVYGIQVSRQETDWMVLVKPSQIIAIEPGKLYGWRDVWAVSVRYRDANEKEQKVLISFVNASSQVSFVNYLRDKGFAVSSGQYPVTGPVWNA
jgi:hypothetical protein